jgi:hypothetical protein
MMPVFKGIRLIEIGVTLGLEVINSFWNGINKAGL